MKRLLFAFISIFTMLPGAYAEYFVGNYHDDSPTPVEYQLVFQTLDNAPDEVGVYYNFSDGEGFRVENYNDITNLRLPETVTFDGKSYKVSTILELGNWGFSGKIYGTLYIPKTVTRISGKIGLSVESIVIEDAPIEEIDIIRAGFDCPNLKAIDFGNAIKYIVGFHTYTVGDIVSGCPSLESVSIPASVIKIDEQAFQGIPALKSVSLSSSIKCIGDEAFADCENLTEVETYDKSDNIVDFGRSVFKNCKALKSVSLPNVKTIANDMFRYCNSLEYVKIGDKSFEDNESDDSYDVGGIGDYAFENCSKLAKIDMPLTFKTIGESAFAGCSALKSISILWNTYIGTGAFSGCTSITKFTVEGKPDEGYDYFFTEDGVLYHQGQVWISDEMLKDWTTLFAYPAGKSATTFTVPSNVNKVGHSAFSGAAHLEEVNIPASVEKIGINIFAGCPKLRKVNLPDGMEYIPYGTFSDCPKLKEVSLPDNMVYISGSAFADCESLAEIKLPKQLKILGNSSFYGCKSLKTISIPDGVTEIRANTLGNCTSLQSVTLPAALDSIQSGAFQGCSSLLSVNLPSALTGVGVRAFKDCTSLQAVAIPHGVKNLGLSAFENCTSLRTADTGDGMEKVGEFSFYNCSALESVTLGASLTEIGDEAFKGADAITSIVCKSTTPPSYPTGFSPEVINNASVTVPEGSEDLYHNNPAWAPMVEGSSGIENPTPDNDMEYSIFNINGVCLLTGCRGCEITGLPQGIYILRYSDGTIKKLLL